MARISRRGLTLIELTIVLLILAATAGIIIPRLIGYVGRTHGATGAANITEVSKALALSQADNGGLGDNWDGLVTTAGATYDQVVEAGVATPLATATLIAEEADALTAVGITTLFNMDDGTKAGFNATFDPYDAGGATTAIAGGNTIAVLNAAAITDLGLTAGNNYAVFGLGRQSSLIGTTVVEPPVHFPEGGENPEDVYLRFVAVFELGDGTAGGTEERARFVGIFTIEPETGEITNGDDHQLEFYENRNG